MNNSLLGDKFDSVRRAASTALKRTGNITGRSTDSAVSIYEKLKPEQFDIIARVYGEEGLSKYIKSMEARRLKGK